MREIDFSAGTSKHFYTIYGDSAYKHVQINPAATIYPTCVCKRLPMPYALYATVYALCATTVLIRNVLLLL